jgi:hypothetical protein
VAKLLYAFLLIDPTRQRKLYDDFHMVLNRISAQGGIIKDVSTGLDSSDKARATVLKDVVRGQIRRHKQGAQWAENEVLHKPGRKLVEFTKEQTAAAKAVWRDLVEYPTWADADTALDEIRSRDGRPFTRWRARRLWGQRQPKRKRS